MLYLSHSVTRYEAEAIGKAISDLIFALTNQPQAGPPIPTIPTIPTIERGLDGKFASRDGASHHDPPKQSNAPAGPTVHAARRRRRRGRKSIEVTIPAPEALSSSRDGSSRNAAEL